MSEQAVGVGGQPPTPLPKASSRARKFAYADPPYPGRSHLYKSVDRPGAVEVDHAELIDRLVADYPDGWALSTDERGLWVVIPLLIERRRKIKARIVIWHQPDASPMGIGHPQGRDSRIGLAWEAVVIAGGRGRGAGVGDVMDHASIIRTNRNAGFVGEKPAAFAVWVCRLLGVVAGDQVDDLYPGSGAFGRAVEAFLMQPPLLNPPRQTMRKSGKIRSSRGWRTAQDTLPYVDVA